MLADVTEPDVVEARPDEVSFTLTWLPDGEALTGELEARNVGERRVRLTGKPGLTPLDVDGQPLDTVAIITLELVVPGYIELGPGESATARIGWAGWDGLTAGGAVRVEWPGGHADVSTLGPQQPAGNGPPTNLWSSWFVRADS